MSENIEVFGTWWGMLRDYPAEIRKHIAEDEDILVVGILYGDIVLRKYANYFGFQESVFNLYCIFKAYADIDPSHGITRKFGTLAINNFNDIGSLLSG